MPHGATLGGLAAQIATSSIESSINFNSRRHLDVAVDVAMLSGKASLANEKRPDVEINPEIIGTIPEGPTSYAFVPPVFAPTTATDDFDGDGVPDEIMINGDGTVDVWLSGTGSDPGSDPPDLTRLEDTAPDVFDREKK